MCSWRAWRAGLRYTPTGISGNPSGTVFGYGGNLTASIKTFGDDSIKGQIAYGKAIATYSNDCCFDLAPNAAWHRVVVANNGVD